MSRTNNAVRNIIWGMINKIVTIILPFLMRTIMIYYMGMEYLGLNGLFSSILSMLSLSELGFSSAIVFSMYKPVAENDYDTVSALLNFYKKCYSIVGMVILVVGLAISPFLNYLVNGDCPADVNLYILYYIYLFNTVIGYFLFAYKKSLLAAYQRNDIESNITTLIVTMQYVFQAVIVITTRNYYAYLVVLPILTVVNNIVTSVIVDKKFPQIKCSGRISKEYADSIKKKISGLLAQKIGTTVLNSADNMIISAFLGLTALALYNNYYFIMSSVAGMLGILMSSIINVIGNSLVEKKKDDCYQDYQKFNILYVWIVSWATVCLICLYQHFMRIWVHEENMLPMYMVVLFAVYFFTNKQNDLCGIYKQAAGIWWEGRWMPLVAATVNLTVNIVLVQIIGLAGIVLSTIVSLVCVYFPWGTYILYKHFFNNIKHGFSRHLWMQIGYAISCVVMSLVTYIICNLLPNEGIAWLVIKLGICMVVPNVIFVAIFCRSLAFKDAMRFIKRYLYRKMGGTN